MILKQKKGSMDNLLWSITDDKYTNILKNFTIYLLTAEEAIG